MTGLQHAMVTRFFAEGGRLEDLDSAEQLLAALSSIPSIEDWIAALAAARGFDEREKVGSGTRNPLA